jgi:hypothetical protein
MWRFSYTSQYFFRKGNFLSIEKLSSSNVYIIIIIISSSSSSSSSSSTVVVEAAAAVVLRKWRHDIEALAFFRSIVALNPARLTWKMLAFVFLLAMLGMS